MGKAELFVARTCMQGPVIHSFHTFTERNGDWPKATEQVGMAEP